MAQITPHQITLPNGATLTLRSAQPSDAAAVLKLALAVLSEQQYTVTLPAELTITAEQQAVLLAQMAATAHNLFLIATIEIINSVSIISHLATSDPDKSLAQPPRQQPRAQEIIGMLDFRANPRQRQAHTGEFGMNVAAAWRGQKVGQALLQTLINWAGTQPQLEKICLSVFANNERGINLYQKLGFQVEGYRRGSYRVAPQHYVDEVLMAYFLREQPSAPPPGLQP
jgi:RimJ/RimL family protein N-acetyltransferase